VPRFVDSSVVIRYLTRDDEARSRVARDIIEGEDGLALSTLVLSETAYTLRSRFRHSWQDVLNVLIDFVQLENIEVVDATKELVVVALEKSRARRSLSFGDALLLAQMQTAGLKEIYTFDAGFRDENIVVRDRPPGRK
jgi:predicted nucleic acid-binding protein